MRTDYVNQRLVAGGSRVGVESETTVGGLAFTAILQQLANRIIVAQFCIRQPQGVGETA